MYSCKTELFETELIICIKMDLGLNNLQRLIGHKTQTTSQPNTNNLQLCGFKYFYQIQIICTRLYGFKYSYLIQIICTQLYGFKYSYLIQIIRTHFYGFKYFCLIQIIYMQFYGLVYSATYKFLMGNLMPKVDPFENF